MEGPALLLHMDLQAAVLTTSAGGPETASAVLVRFVLAFQRRLKLTCLQVPLALGAFQQGPGC